MVLKQCKNYMDENIRLDMARRMEIASLHNIRANLKYYEKKNKKEFQESVSTMSEYITQMNCAMSVNEMMLIEAKARQL